MSLQNTFHTLGKRLRLRPKRSRRKGRNLSDTSEESAMKCVVVGDRGVGKSSLLVRYTADYFVFNSQDMPSGPVFDSHTGHPVTLEAGEIQYTMTLFDTFSQKDRETTRVACYPGTDVCLICFSVVDPTSFKNVETLWLPEVRRNLPRTPVILVGNQIDLRDDLSVVQNLSKSREMPILREEGEKLSRKLKAKGYVECSALTMNGIEAVFDRVVLRVLRERQKGRESAVRKIGRAFERLKKRPHSRSRTWPVNS